MTSSESQRSTTMRGADCPKSRKERPTLSMIAEIDDAVWFSFKETIDLKTQNEYGGIPLCLPGRPRRTARQARERSNCAPRPWYRRFRNARAAPPPNASDRRRRWSGGSPRHSLGRLFFDKKSSFTSPEVRLPVPRISRFLVVLFIIGGAL